MKLKYIRKFFLISSILLFVVLILFVSAVLLLQRPKVQTNVVNKVLTNIENKYDTEANIESVHFKFPTSLVLNSFYLEDQKGDTLIFANELNAKFSFLQPFKRKVHISKVTLDGAKINLSKSTDHPYNFDFLFPKTEKIDKVKPKNSKPFDLAIYTIDLKNTSVNIIDEENFTLSPATLKQLKININEFDVEQKSLSLQNVLVDELNIAYLNNGVKKEKQPFSLESFLPNLGWQIDAKNIEIVASNVRLINPNAKTSSLPLDLNDLHLQNINTTIEDVKLDSTLSLNLVDLNGKIGNQIKIKEFYSKINVSENQLELKRLGLNFNNSAIELNAALTVKDFDKFPEYFQQNSELKGFIAASDANLFLPKANHVNKGLQVDLKSKGSLQHLTLQNLQLKSGEIAFRGNGIIKALLTSDQTNFNLNINRLTGSAEKINQIVPWLVLPDQINSLGNTVATGNVSGKMNNLIANLEVNSEVGNLNTVVNLDASGNELAYTGEVSIPVINIKSIFPNAPVGVASGTLELSGMGTDLAGLQGKIKGRLNEIEFNNYTYKNVDINGKIKDQVFNGDINVNDENLAMFFDGTLDLSDSIPKMKSQLDVKNANLKALKLNEKTFNVALNGNVDVSGTDLTNLNGYLNLASLHIENDSNSVDFDTTLFKIVSEPNFKSYDILSDKMNAHVEGDFDPIVLTNEFQRYFTNYVYYLNFADTSTLQPQHIKGDISIAEEFGLIKFLLGTVDIPENIIGNFEFNNTEDIFKLNAHANHLGYKQIAIDSFYLDAYTEDDELIIDANFGKLLAANNKVNVDLIDLFAVSTKNSIAANFEIEEEDAPNRFSLSPHLNFYKDSILVHFNNSYFKVNDIEWPFTANNEIILKKDEIIANNFAIQNENQSLQIVNAASDLSDALIEFHNLDIPSLANIVQLDTIIQDGLLTGRIRLENALKEMNADVDLSFTSLQVFDFYCDSLSIDAFYDKSKNRIDVGALFDDPNYDLFASGYYDLAADEYNAANLDIDVNRLDLSFLDLILKNEAHFDLFGEGDLQFKGSVFKPILLGEAYVIDTATITIDFLGTDLIIMPENGVREKVIFTENTIDLQSMNVRDPYGNRAYAEGKLTHFHFKDMSVDARLFTDNFNLLNTTFNDNEDFYGLAFGEGSVTFSGLTRNINMDIDMTTKKGTRVSIPIASVGDTKEYNFEFINPDEEKIDENIIEDLIEIKGVNLNFDLEVTKDAELELVLNTESENNLTAIGQGDLSLRIDQNKQLSIYGKYNLIDGDYVFSPQNLINKEFKIENGSSIFWNGNPYQAALDVDALYKVDARVDNIIQDSLRSAQLIPMDVVIHIGGTLNETDVSFGIEPRRSSLVTAIDEVQSFLDEIQNDEGEITTQAISLLLVGRFLPSNSTVFTGTSFSAGEFGKTTALELVSNQVSSYLTDAISKLITEVEFNVNIAQREDYTLEEPGQTTTVQLEYSQKLINNRLIVNIGGNFSFQDEESEEENTIAGDFEVEGLLTEDGKLRAKAFHRTADYDIFNQDRSKTGVSISYTKDFDNIGEVFKPDENKKKKRQENRQKRKSNKENKKSIRDAEKAAATKDEDDDTN